MEIEAQQDLGWETYWRRITFGKNESGGPGKYLGGKATVLASRDTCCAGGQ